MTAIVPRKKRGAINTNITISSKLFFNRLVQKMLKNGLR